MRVLLSLALLLACSPAFAAGEGASAALSPIIVDAGHGGNDLGAVVHGRREKDITLAIARKLKARLETLSSTPVHLTRDSDTFIQLDARVAGSLSLGGGAFISLHVNQVRSKKQAGIIVYSFGKSSWRDRRPLRRKVAPLPPPSQDQARASGVFASSMARGLRADGFKVEAAARAQYYVLKNPSVPSILVELGYLSNPKEAAQLAEPAYQDRLADALARSLTAYLAGKSTGVSAKAR